MKSLLFSFQGRLNRAPYWYVHLVLMAIQLGVFGALFATLVHPAMLAQDPVMLASASNTLNLVGLLFLPLYWIGLVVTIKRCHDRDKSGWWILIALIPLIGALLFLVEFGFLRGTVGPNRFGPDPLGA